MNKKFRKVRILFPICLFMLMLCLKTNWIQASDYAEGVVREYVDAMDSHDWDKFSNLYCESERNSLQQFFADPMNKVEYNGVLNIKNAKLTELVEINLVDVVEMLYKQYDPDNTKVFVFGVDYDVFEDSKYFSSGINYNFVTCINENGCWKISEMLPIEYPEKLLECGYKFSDDFDTTILVMNARQNGYLINYEGELFASLNEDNISSTYAVINKRVIPNQNTTVRYKDSSGKINNIKFHKYCLGVLAGELRSVDFDGEIRKAQAIAIKTFTWHYLIIPHGAAEGYDVNSVQQNYYPSKISENPKVTTDYNAVKSVWMESYKGAIFVAHYKQGKYEEPIQYKNNGEFKQEGARWLYDNGKVRTYKALLKYFYDSSDASTGGPIRFFDHDKNEI